MKTPPTAATATACAAPRSRKASRRSRKNVRRSFDEVCRAEILAALCCRAAIARLESPLFYRLTRGCRCLAYACGGALLMPSFGAYLGRQALDFVDAIEASQTSASVVAH